MRPARILILNLNPSDCLGADLHAIVESQFDVEEVKFEEQIGPDSEATECGKKLARVISSSGSDFSVIIAVQSADRLKHTRRLFLSPEIEIPTKPLLVVVDEAEPEEMIEWIKQLAADFITKPLKTIDVLPRIWRLLDQASESETELRQIKQELGMRQLVLRSHRLVKFGRRRVRCQWMRQPQTAMRQPAPLDRLPMLHCCPPPCG